MPSVFRGGLLVGGLCLLVLLAVPALADDVQHEHPDEVDGSDDLEGVERWLGDRLGEVHVDCAEGIRLGSFDACEDLDRDGRYAELLDRYATVENDLESDTETAERYNETREQQQEYAALREEFERTYTEYLEARAAGNDAEARELARELRRLADRIEALGGDISVNFLELEETTNADLTTAAESINESTNEVRTVVLEVEAESFETAQLNATATDTASFAEPAVISGRVLTENGSGVSGADVTLTDGEQSFVTTADADGSYELSYRPTRTRTGETELTVAYRPAPDAAYLGADANVTTEVRATDSTLRIENRSTEVAFGEQLLVSGVVRADNASVPGVDVSLFADDERLATTRTDADGRFRATTAVPATLTPGAETIEVRASEPDRAIRPSRATTELAVLETATELSVSATATDETIDVSGQLRADADAPVGARPVSVRIGDETYGVRTEADGRYRLAVENEFDEAPENVTATYEEPGSNLGSSRAGAAVSSASGEAASPSTAAGLLSTIRDNALSIALAGIAVALALSGALYRVASRDANIDDESSQMSTPTDTDADGGDASITTTIEDVLSIAREKLRTDPQATVYASYAAVRSLFDPSAEQTHWEFYERERSVGNDRPSDDLHTLTELFERAAFAADDVDAAQARAALAAAERYLESTDARESTD